MKQWRVVYADGWESIHYFSPRHPLEMAANEDAINRRGAAKVQHREFPDGEWIDGE